MTIYSKIDQELAAAALYVDQGGTLSIDSLLTGSGTALTDEFAMELMKFGYWFKRYSMSLAGFSCIIFVVSGLNR